MSKEQPTLEREQADTFNSWQLALRLQGEVLEEAHRQDDKYGPGDALGRDWLGVLGEEFGEAARAQVRGVTDPDHDLRRELVQLAAVALRWVLALDRLAIKTDETETT